MEKIIFLTAELVIISICVIAIVLAFTAYFNNGVNMDLVHAIVFVLLTILGIIYAIGIIKD